jgi:hypothetical protein
VLLAFTMLLLPLKLLYNIAATLAVSSYTALLSLPLLLTSATAATATTATTAAIITITAAKHQQIRLRVFDWWFFVRVALEYDLGLARSYMAGEWVCEHDTVYADGLRQLFLLFVDNRDVPNGQGMKVTRLLTSWVGYTVSTRTI